MTVSEPVLAAFSGSVAGMGAMCLTYPLVIASTRDAVKERKKAVKASAAAADADGAKTYADAAAEGVEEVKEAVEQAKDGAAGKDADEALVKVKKAAAKALATAKDSSTVLQILSAEGLAGLYAGLSSSLVGIAVTNGVYYGAYSLASDGARKASPTGTTLTVGQSILAGVVAGSATTLITNPLWVVQTHQATFTHLHPDAAAPSIGQSAHMIYKQGGAKAFWRGIKAALVLVANPVLQYTAFEQLKKVLLAARRRKSPAATAVAGLSSADLFVLGALAKLFATSLSYPLVLLKSRLQSASHAYPSIPAALKHIVRSEGVSGLYAGLQAKLLQSVLTAALLFAGQQRVYEAVKRALVKV